MIAALPTDTPATDAALFDVLHTWFGIGNFDEAADLPWWKFRMTEISKIKKSRASRDVSIAELYLAALYAHSYGKDVRAVTWLYPLLRDGRAWWEARAAVDAAVDFEQAYSDAIAYETGRGELGLVWRDQLLRAQGESREEVFAQWLSQHTQR